MKLVNGIILLLILICILFASFSSINAAYANDDLNNGYSNVTYNDLSGLQTNGNDLNQNNSKVVCLNNSEVEKNLGSDISSSIQASVSNDSNNNFDYLNYIDLVDVNQTSDNTFTYVMDNVSYTVYRVAVYDLQTFRDAADFVSQDIDYDMILMDFKNNLILDIDPWNDVLIGLGKVKNIVMRGNGATISVFEQSKYDKVHLMTVDSDYKLWMNNITIKGFNAAIVNGGTCQFNDVVFNSNSLSKDYGGAIINNGILKCLNCSFSNNKAKCGGAVYNSQGSQSMFFNCIFSDNYGSSKGKLETNDGNNVYSAKGANCIILSDNDTYYSIVINNTQDFYDVLNAVDKLDHIRVLMLNFTPNTYKLSNTKGYKISLDSVENLIIYGNGATISVDTSKSDECHFLNVIAGQNFQINDLIITGFNKAIFNEGSLSFTNTTFRKNKCDYYVAKDYGGAIYNNEGILYLTQCRFEDCYAKYGGAIYNNQGIVRCDSSNFESNTAYSDGGAIYNNKGHLTALNTFFINNTAKDDGGALFNHYGMVVLDGEIFNANVAHDEGGAIYNDFGTVLISDSMFIESKSDRGRDILSYGDESCCFVTDSYSIHQVEGGFICQQLKIASKAPSQTLRWILRITEIGLCISLCVVCSFLGIPEATAGIICFIGGGILAASEELIEECYLDHNFHIGNVLMMSVVAGAFDGITGAAGTAIGKICFKTATQELTKLAALELASICFALDVAGEIATEFIPRVDFNKFDVPTPTWDTELPTNEIS